MRGTSSRTRATALLVVGAALGFTLHAYETSAHATDCGEALIIYRFEELRVLEGEIDDEEREWWHERAYLNPDQRYIEFDAGEDYWSWRLEEAG